MSRDSDYTMSEDDDGIKEIRFHLNDGTTLVASGSDDFFNFDYYEDYNNKIHVYVPMADLLDELSDETKRRIFDESDSSSDDWIIL